MRYFIDCEFDGFRGPLISMALVREDGRSLYFVISGAEEAATDEWVKANVLPILKDSPEAPYVLLPEHAAMAISQFLDGDEGVHIVADWPDDLRHFCDLIVVEPGQMIPLPSFTMEVKRVDAYPTEVEGAVRHHAWWDAVALMDKVERLEAATAQPEPGVPTGTRDLSVGDVVTLRSGSAPMTVLEVAADVSVSWMTPTGEMHEHPLPAAALVRASA